MSAVEQKRGAELRLVESEDNGEKLFVLADKYLAGEQVNMRAFNAALKRFLAEHRSVPPHDLDAEAAVISAVFLDATTYSQVVDILRAEHFYSDANRRIFEAIVSLSADGKPIDIVSVSSWLRDRQWLAIVGGNAYLAQISDATPSIANVKNHARIVFEKWRVRQTIATCQRVAAEGFGDVGAVQEFIDGSVRSLETIARATTGARLATIALAVDEAYDAIEQVKARAGQVLGYTTGIKAFDDYTGGLVPSDLTLVGARMKMPDGRIKTTSAGKTSWVTGVALHVAETPYRTFVRLPDGQRVQHEEKIGVLLFCLEMTRAQMAARLACQIARVSWDKLRAGHYTDKATGELEADINVRIAEAMTYLKTLPIVFHTEKPLKPSGVRAKVLAAREQLMQEHGAKLGLVVVDSIGWMNAERDTRDGNREKELNETGRDLRDLSKDERIPGIHYIVVTQVQENTAPKDCRSLRDHAVNFIIVEVNADPKSDELEGEINIDKQRDGRTDPVPIRFLKKYGIFTDV